MARTAKKTPTPYISAGDSLTALAPSGPRGAVVRVQELDGHAADTQLVPGPLGVAHGHDLSVVRDIAAVSSG